MTQHRQMNLDNGGLLRIDGVIVDQPVIQPFGKNRRYATCTIRTVGAVGSGHSAQNATWSVVVHRQPAVEQLCAADPGDLISLHGIVQTGQIIVPRSNGRIDLILV